MDNLLLLTDSYKASHYKQYPPGTEYVYSYFESRGGDFKEGCFFGLQYYLDKYLVGQQVTQEKLDEAKDVWGAHFGDASMFNYAGWKHVLDVHGGKLPVRIKAVPEGTVVPASNVFMTIENTDPECYWLTNYLETLLVQVWYGTTVATQSREMKKVLNQYLVKTGDPKLIDFKLHDFGFRGVSSVETAGVGGAAHLVSFRGTDTTPGILVARKHYGCPMAGFSIPASEHSTITSWGRNGELDAFRNMLEKYPKGLVACVSDSFDIFRACSHFWGEELKDKVLSRDGCLVVRPDSGDPPTTVVKVLTILGSKFGFSYNEKGWKVLDPHVRVIQGDGIDRKMLELVLIEMDQAGWSTDNIAFGSGGGLLQKLNRDTMKFAFKCAAVTVDGVERDVFKQPVTDPGKVSKSGRMKLIRSGSTFATVSSNDSHQDELVTVFRDGEIVRRWTFDDIRTRAAI
jgi:nicotinamide phosphoribosyltransferase